jgi:hypothetical protein
MENPELAVKPESLDEWAKYIYEWCERKGWNQNLDFPKMLMNLHSEVTEAWEECRNGRAIDEVYESEGGKPEGVPIELVDLLIRFLHIAAWRGWNLQELLEQKMAYNEKRPFRHGNKTA